MASAHRSWAIGTASQGRCNAAPATATNTPFGTSRGADTRVDRDREESDMTLTLRPPEHRVGAPEPDPEWLPTGRPLEDRSFEAVETTAGAAVGVAFGMAVAGPIGAVVGGVVGGVVAYEAGESLERSMGLVARTTDATTEHTPPVD
jgi:hypothetical protein